jgi:hypothetical protein
MRQDRVFRIASLLGAAFGLAILLPVVAAQAADDGGRTADDPRTRVAARLLHSGGGVVRADSRWVEDHWEIRQDGAWRALPSGWVTEARLEKDVLKESAKRIGAARRGGPVEHVQLAEWMFVEGLYKEAFATLDDVLRERPDHAEALGLLHSGTLPILLPPIDVPADRLAEAHEALLDFASTSPPALREIAVHRLSTSADPDGLRELLQPRLTAKSAGVRSSAMLTLHRLPPRAEADEDELSTLLRRAVLDRADEVRMHASLALGDVGEEGLIVPIVAALDSKHPQVRMNAAQSLGQMGYRSAVEPLVNSLVNLAPGDGAFRPRGTIHVGRQIAFVQDFDVDVAQAAAIGDPTIGTIQEGATLDVRVMGVSGPSAAAQSATLRKALENLTGAQPGKTRSAWKSWWKANASSFTDAPVGDPGRYAPR